MLSFRTTITVAVMILITTLAACLIVIQVLAFHAAAKEAASAYMDAASATALSRLEAQISELNALIAVLSTSPFLADSDDRSEVGGAVGLFKTALNEVPQADSFYVGYENGCWLQVRGLADLDPGQRQLLGAPLAAVTNINLVRPGPGGALPMRRIFEDQEGDKIDQFDLSNYGYDPRQRSWYRDTLRAGRAVVSSPYASFSIGVPMITLSAPLKGSVRGVIAADLKLDKFSDFVNAQRPGEHGTAVLFDAFGALIAYPDFARLVDYAMTHPAHPKLPAITEVKGRMVEAVMRGWDGSDRYEGSLPGDDGGSHFFRLRKFPLSPTYDVYLLLIAAEDDFVPNVRRLQIKALALALLVGGCFVPAAWIFGGRLSGSLRRVTAQAGRLRTLATPDPSPLTSHITEIHQLGETMALAQRTIWSFARFVPEEIVRGIIAGSIGTELGGVRQEVTILFTDVRNFTGIAEAADPDVLMHQASRHFTALTEAFLAEGGTVDKFIGDAVMVFWNAPLLQPDHVERACRAALAAKRASEALNAEFEAEGLPPFVTRIGLHVGDVVVGNLGSAERMEYTVLGSAVNLASRLEGLNKEYDTTILVSEAVRARVAHHFRLKAVASVTAKGMAQATEVYELLDAVAPENAPSGEAAQPGAAAIADGGAGRGH
jgi:adenylate cyclase